MFSVFSLLLFLLIMTNAAFGDRTIMLATTYELCFILKQLYVGKRFKGHSMTLFRSLLTHHYFGSLSCLNCQMNLTIVIESYPSV